MNLWKYFLENDGNKITRWTHYFPIYEKHFERFRNKPVKILEIGVLNGGSLPMWQKYFGPLSKINHVLGNDHLTPLRTYGGKISNHPDEDERQN